MDWIVEIFRQNQVIPIFLTLGLGFWLGSLRYKQLTLGPVTATLLVGVVIGQMGIDIAPEVKSLVFMFFLFAIGYSVGPQFFRSLKGDGLKQIAFALVECVVCIGVCVGAAWLMGYDKGVAVGIFAGSQTVSAVIGVGSDTIRSLGYSEAETERLLNIIPACYAVCYVYGTVGSAWITANLGPWLLGGMKRVKAETQRIEAEMDQGDFTPEPGQIVANRPVSFRAYRAESAFFDHPRTIREIGRHIKALGLRHYVERVRVDGEVSEPDPDLRVRRGDILVLSGRRESIVDNATWVGPEVVDHELLTFGTENLPVVVSKKGAAGVSIGELRTKPFMQGVMIHKVVRNGMLLPLRKRVELERGDVVTLVGHPERVAEAVPEIGYSDRATRHTDLAFVGIGIALGCLIGAVVIRLGGVPLSLSTSGGAIIAGLLLGWLRTKRPTFGKIPSSVLWFMDNAGLNLFIAVVGITAGPSFISGLQEVGFQLLLVGVVCTTLPLVLCIFIGNKLFGFPAAVTLGCVAGSRNAVAAIGVIQDSLESSLPVMGYTVTYAVGSVVLILSGMVIALLA